MKKAITKHDKDLILGEFKEEFEKMKKELGFKASLKELNKVFYLNDHILKVGFVSENLSRLVCARMVETLSAWSNYLHSLLIPNPNSLMNVTESSIFNDEEKEEMGKFINKTLAITSANTLAGLTKDKKLEAEFIDNALEFWKKTLNPKMTEVMKKVNEGWKEKSK